MLETFFVCKDTALKTKAVLQKNLHAAFFLICSCLLYTQVYAVPSHSGFSKQENPDKRVLLNGRIWWNQYSKAIGDQYFLDGSFLKGSVVYNGKHYYGLDLKYDIANDEVLLSSENHPVICMNKEMVDSFTLEFRNNNYTIFNAGNDTSSILKGYVNLLYNGPSALYVKFTKKIYPLAVDGRFDLFSEDHRVFLNTVNGIVVVKGKKQLFNILKGKKKELIHFLRENKLKCNFKNPYSIIPVVRHYDNIIKLKP